MSGKLYIVATPIGNLGDITLRALETLKAVDKVVAEDTRMTGKLLAHYQIKKPMVSLRARSTRAAFEKIAELVEAGETLAYVTDAGTPGISDPGPLLVSLVRELCGEAAVAVIPGASALAAAVSVAGVPLNEFVFIGFLPHKKGRQKALDTLVARDMPTVLYESPHRIEKLLDELLVRSPQATVVIARELTKLYEQVAVGTATELQVRLGKDQPDDGLAGIPTRGEFVVIVRPAKL